MSERSERLRKEHGIIKGTFGTSPNPQYAGYDPVKVADYQDKRINVSLNEGKVGKYDKGNCN
jgi:hypothetical protein